MILCQWIEVADELRLRIVVESGDKFRDPKPAKVELTGVDLFLSYTGKPDDLAAKVKDMGNGMMLQAITNRGTKVWPNGDKNTFCVPLSFSGRQRRQEKCPDVRYH